MEADFFSRINIHKGPSAMRQSAQSTPEHTDLFHRVSLGNFRKLLEVEGGPSHTPQFP